MDLEKNHTSSAIQTVNLSEAPLSVLQATGAPRIRAYGRMFATGHAKTPKKMTEVLVA